MKWLGTRGVVLLLLAAVSTWTPACDADGEAADGADADADTDADDGGGAGGGGGAAGDADAEADGDADDDRDADSDEDGEAETDGDTRPDGLALEDLLTEVSAAICETLFRCCSPGHRALYFQPYAASPRLEDAGYAGRLPPAVDLPADACPDLVREMLQIRPFGPWVDEARAGHVTYRPDEAATCLETLRDAACGAEAWRALVDPTCFGFVPPMGGDEQRRAFRRFLGVGEDCVQLTDGIGGGVYGTCDPEVAWCCRPSEADPDLCAIRDGIPGRCAPVSDLGETCSYFPPPVQVCATGAYCDGETGSCAEDAPSGTVLELGETCMVDYEVVGDCRDGYCDAVALDAVCVPFRAVGEDCFFAYECETGACDGGRCIAAFCNGGS